MFQTKVGEGKKNFVFGNFFFNRAIYEIMWKNIVEQSRPQMTIWRMRIACWITKGHIYPHTSSKVCVDIGSNLRYGTKSSCDNDLHCFTAVCGTNLRRRGRSFESKIPVISVSVLKLRTATTFIEFLIQPVLSAFLVDITKCCADLHSVMLSLQISQTRCTRPSSETCSFDYLHT